MPYRTQFDYYNHVLGKCWDLAVSESSNRCGHQVLHMAATSTLYYSLMNKAEADHSSTPDQKSYR